ncbi:hypothetical protein [Thioalkalivibrio paradoxus]|uniref:Lipoprotein n=1 Tax=Thioalkalivibrio paradoxus ARh 1 TaxID=713585 RepID=W0DMJ0_9GAMM|nr:hypothetical protein [Thioalkalivibrio paradoxus]AHE98115.1 hypothetical protein THITH_07395 [Thioalkalivibrio paradoxus ARh 1]
MPMKNKFFLLAITLAFGAAGCSPEDTAEAPAGALPPAVEAPATPAPPYTDAGAPATGQDTAGGLLWSVPGHWQTEGQRPMRAATYHTPAADGDPDPGEVAVFYFGPTEGGTVDANVDRWFGQFDQDDGRPTHEVAERESTEIAGMPVTVVRAAGTYNAAAGPMAPRADLRPGYRLIGAIVEGPEGAVFFKFTGPAQTVADEEPHFLAMIESIGRQE